MRRVLLHGSSEASFDDAVRFARPLIAAGGAELHVVYTGAEPLWGGWTAETTPDRLPELHQAIDAEARERLARVFGPRADDIIIAIRTGDATRELTRYTAENAIDLAIVRGGDDHARGLIAHGHCSVMLLR